MKISKLLLTLVACSGLTVASFAASGSQSGQSGNDTMGAAKGGTTAMRAHEITGTLESYSSSDSMIIVKTTRMSDTIKVTAATDIMMNGQMKTASDLETGKKITVWYQMENGQKVATKIRENMGAKKGKKGAASDTGAGAGGGTGGTGSGGTGGSGSGY